MAFTRIRTIKGQNYLYQEERWREGGKVRSRSISLGPVTRKRGFLANFAAPPHGFRMEERLMAQGADRQARDEAALGELVAGLHEKFGLTMGSSETPIEKPVPSLSLGAPVSVQTAPDTQEAASPDGEAEGQ